MAIATSSHKRHYDIKTTKHRQLFDKMFDHVVTGDDVENSKPDPEIFIKAAEKFDGENIDASKVLVFEDAPLGVQAANSAKMSVVWVYDQQQQRDSEIEANQCIETLFDFKPQMFNLPSF